MPASGAATLMRSSSAVTAQLCTAARVPGDAEAIRVHLGSRAEVIERADAEPRFHARGRVTARIPPPKPLVARAGMDALNFSGEHGVEHEADVTVAREPCAIALVNGGAFVAVADAVGDEPPMTAFVGWSAQAASDSSARTTRR